MFGRILEWTFGRWIDPLTGAPGPQTTATVSWETGTNKGVATPPQGWPFPATYNGTVAGTFNAPSTQSFTYAIGNFFNYNGTVSPSLVPASYIGTGTPPGSDALPTGLTVTYDPPTVTYVDGVPNASSVTVTIAVASGAQEFSGNVGSGSVEELSEWIEYMTAATNSVMSNMRRKNGRDKPWKIPFVGIGNESWDCGGAMTPDYYVSLMKVYSRFVLNMNPAQRGKDQMLKIAVGPGTPDTEWTEAVMKAWKKHTWAWDINGVSLHWYTVPNGWPPSTNSEKFGLDDYAKTLKSTLFMDEFLRKQEAVMDKYDPEKKVTVSVDEWGAWHAPLAGSNPATPTSSEAIRS